jgi:hypothetical protein
MWKSARRARSKRAQPQKEEKKSDSDELGGSGLIPKCTATLIVTFG